MFCVTSLSNSAFIISGISTPASFEIDFKASISCVSTSPVKALAIVGEKGPELVELPMGAKVYDTNRTSSMLGKGGITQNITINSPKPLSPSLIKRKTLEDYIEKGLYPYSKYYLGNVKKMRGRYYDGHFSTIGLVGMNEALFNFIGENISSRRGRRFALEIMDFMREKLVDYQKETGNLYNLEATPAEGTTYRFAKEDKKRYGDSILQAGMGENIYYTNSSQIPVDLTNDPFEAITLQDDLQCKYTGGTVLHRYMREKISSSEAARKLVRTVISNFRLPYITITPTFSICEKHGYLSGEYEYCPKCDEEILHKVC